MYTESYTFDRIVQDIADRMFGEFIPDPAKRDDTDISSNLAYRLLPLGRVEYALAMGLSSKLRAEYLTRHLSADRRPIVSFRDRKGKRAFGRGVRQVKPLDIDIMSIKSHPETGIFAYDEGFYFYGGPEIKMGTRVSSRLLTKYIIVTGVLTNPEEIRYANEHLSDLGIYPSGMVGITGSSTVLDNDLGLRYALGMKYIEDIADKLARDLVEETRKQSKKVTLVGIDTDGLRLAEDVWLAASVHYPEIDVSLTEQPIYHVDKTTPVIPDKIKDKIKDNDVVIVDTVEFTGRTRHDMERYVYSVLHGFGAGRIGHMVAIDLSGSFSGNGNYMFAYANLVEIPQHYMNPFSKGAHLYMAGTRTNGRPATVSLG